MKLIKSLIFLFILFFTSMMFYYSYTKDSILNKNFPGDNLEGIVKTEEILFEKYPLILKGSYHEDPALNPEDPVSGLIEFRIEKEGEFEVDMFFTFLGCQNQSLGVAKGVIDGNKLVGNWSGLIDNTQQSGEFNGEFNEEKSLYEGTYVVAGGKQKIIVPDCVEYYISPRGTWITEVIN